MLRLIFALSVFKYLYVNQRRMFPKLGLNLRKLQVDYLLQQALTSGKVLASV